jgi:Protein of unknown function (DUF2723)
LRAALRGPYHRAVKPPAGPQARAAFGTDRAWSVGVFLAALALYVSTLCRTVYFYDSAELAAASALLGIPHPPGYPLYTLLGHLYVRVLPGEPALAVNVMSAVHGALCVALAFLAQRKLGAARVDAVIGAAVLAVGPSFWWNSSVAEVYTTGLAFALATFCALLHAHEQARPRWLLAAALLGGLGFSAHMFVATLGLGYAWLVWQGASTQRARLMGQAALATLAGASVYLYIPLRASMHPAINFAEADDASRFTWLVSGGDYKHWFVSDYAFIERAQLVVERIALHVTWPGVLVAVFGLVWLCRERRDAGIGLCLALAGNIAFFFAYAVHDLEVFFLPTAVVLVLALGPALSALRVRAPAQWLQLALTLTCVGYLGVRAWVVWPAVDLSDNRDAYDYGERVAKFLPQDAVVISTQTPEEWQFRTVFDDYFQKTLGARPDVASIAMTHPSALFAVLRSGRPVFTYVRLAELERYVSFEVAGPVFRIRPLVVNQSQ